MDLNILTSSGEKYNIPIEDRHEELVRRIVNKTDNPNPILIIIIIIITVLMIYVMYIFGIKVSFDGDWYNNDKAMKIAHNRWIDTITIDNETGYVSGDALYINDKKMGVYKDKKIYWINGDIWKRVITAL